MTGGALAANHYLINSTSQINPKVLKKLKGATGKTGAAGAPGPAGAAGAAGGAGPQGVPGAPATALWARVSPLGQLDAGSGVVSTKMEKPGLYEVIFDRPVNSCAYIASVGSAAVSATNTVFDSFEGYAMVEPDEGKPNGVDVETVKGSTGALQSDPFHLAVFC
jgi:hypothetical protein